MDYGVVLFRSPSQWPIPLIQFLEGFVGYMFNSTVRSSAAIEEQCCVKYTSIIASNLGDAY